jgi:hypothetical protein
MTKSKPTDFARISDDAPYGSFGVVSLEMIPKLLVERFGQPSPGDGNKVSGLFAFSNGDGVVFTVYDWKLTDPESSPGELWDHRHDDYPRCGRFDSGFGKRQMRRSAFASPRASRRRPVGNHPHPVRPAKRQAVSVCPCFNPEPCLQPRTWHVAKTSIMAGWVT